MRKTVDVDGIKWLSVSITVVVLVTVFWVWPAWNSGSQTWYWGNNQDSINTMYRNTHPPSGHNADFQFGGSPTEWFTESFMANEPANQMITFVHDTNDPWQYHIEWYNTPMMVDSPLAGAEMDMVSFILTIGRYRGMGMMRLEPFFSAMGSGALGGSMGKPIVAMGSFLPMTMDNFAFMPGDVLGAMVMFMSSFPLTVPLANTCFITSPLSDPGYPGGGVSVPTLSQWGVLVLAVLLPFLYTFVIRRRIRIGRS
jgi:hypothetical protein